MKAGHGVAIGMLLTACAPAMAADALLLSRNYLIHNDFRSDNRSGKNLTREWAQGFIGRYRSDLTPGTFGLGVDLHGFLGVKLDGGRGHAGTGLLPVDSDGRSRSAYSSAGGALRIVQGASTLAYGEMRVATPVFATADKRLQPEYATGWFLDDRTVEGLTLQAGRFTAFKNQDSSSGRGDFAGYGATTRFGGISLAGATWAPADRVWGGAFYASSLEDVWQQTYANLNLHRGPWSLDANLYRTVDAGEARAGKIDTLAYSLMPRLSLAAHTLSLGYQKVEGDTPFDFVGGDSIYLANSVKFADFNGANERSWQARYQWSGKDIGLAGLSISARYVRGSDIDGTHAPQGGAYNPFDGSGYRPQQGRGGKHWERDLDVAYVVQSGAARGLSLSMAHVTHRANAAQGGPDIDRLYLIVEYPLDLQGGFAP
ncbi:OprD family outer membrane porin [Pseudomonas mucidolens]|uniref:OprD family outer membrane porin n=1 Tax=Pseudomonas mucidolens TaxID=46679 RepID=UPI0030DD1BFE